jgi:hypothetical protein
MKNGFVQGGRRNLLRGQKKLSLESIREKYTQKLSKAPPTQKREIYERMLENFARQKNHKPSPGTLW